MTEPWLRMITADIRTDDRRFERIPDESVDVVVFSPPYKKEEGYSEGLMLSLGRLLSRVMKPGGRVFMNFGQLRDDYRRPFKASSLVVSGSHWSKGVTNYLETGQTIIWLKSVAIPCWREEIAEFASRFSSVMDGGIGVMHVVAAVGTSIRKILKGAGRVTQRAHYQPINSPFAMNYCFEYIFTLWKPPEPQFDRLSIGVPFADKTNLKRGTRGKHGDLHCGGDVWFVPHTTTGPTKKKQHKDEFPGGLAERCLRVSGVGPGATVLEPFLGGGTTVCEAKKLGMNAWGIDISAEATKAARGRWRRTKVEAAP